MNARRPENVSQFAEADGVAYDWDMKTLTVTEVARNFRAVLDAVEHGQQEVLLMRNARHVARLVPETPEQNALEVFGNLHRTLDDDAAEALSAALTATRKGKRGRVSELRNPWAG